MGRETRGMATRLAAEDFQERPLLFFRGAVVDIGGNPPFGRGHMARRMNRQRDIEVVERNVAIIALINVVAGYLPQYLPNTGLNTSYYPKNDTYLKRA